MGRGFLSGLVWGSILSVMLVWMVSQMSGMFEMLKTPDEIATTTLEQTPVVEEGDEPADAPITEVRPVDEAPSTPVEPAEPVEEAGETDAAMAADLPDPADQVRQSADSADPAAKPEVPEAGVAPVVISSDAPPQPPQELASPVEQPAPEDTPSIADSAGLPDFERPVVVEPDAPPVAETGDDGSPDAPETRLAEAPATPDVVVMPDAAPIPDVPPVSEAGPPPMPAPAEEPEAETETGASEAETALPRRVQPSEGLADLAPNVKVNRLPAIGREPEVAEAEPDPETAAGGPALDRFAVPFSNPSDRPMMAILLLDAEGATAGGTDLAEFPFPVSHVVDAAMPGAAAAMERYRAAGREVVAMTPLPDGAGPRDVEVAFETYLDRVPEAVAVIDTEAADFQSGRQVAAQVAEILEARGMGMITYPKGLNAATQVARREGVPAKLVFREFDGAGQDGAAIQRFLDQAAFRAGQQSGVILVGRNRPETVAALLEWGLGNRAATVVLAPVSAALQAE